MVWLFSPNLPVGGIWKGSRPGLAFLRVLYEVGWLCVQLFTLSSRLSNHHVYAECLEERLIVVYCLVNEGHGR